MAPDMETFSDGLKFGLGIAAGIALCLFAATRLRRFRRSRSEGQPRQYINLTDLRRDLSSAKLDPDLYKTELEPLLARWEAQYGNQVPVGELETLQQLSAARIDLLEFRRQQVIDREAKKGATIELDAIRRKLNESKETYAGPDREAYVRQVDALLQSLAAKYGSHIPVDDAYEIMKRLESGTGLD